MNSRRPGLLRLWLAVVALSLAAPAAAQDSRPRPWTMALTFENDVFAGTDRYYTNGVKLAWATPELPGTSAAPGVPAWLQSLSRVLSPARSPADRRFASIFLGQEMYTPIDLWRADAIAGDRPYAGFLYAGLGFHRLAATTMDSLTLFAGVVGPAALGGAMQRLVHRTFGFVPPLGWAHQLADEPILGAAFDRKWKHAPVVAFGRLRWEIIGHAGGILSNAATEASGGFLIRAGWDLPADFGAAGQRPGFDGAVLTPISGAGDSSPRKGSSFHVFAGLDAHAVLRDIFLDGNTFRESLRVEKIPLAADVTCGFAVRWGRIVIRYAYTYRTRRFVGEHVPFVTGALSAAFLLGRS